MGRPPRRIIAWGSSVLLLIFLLFILAAWYIKYPDIVSGRIEITSQRPPAIMTSRVSGRLVELMATDNQQTTKGSLLAVIESSASFSDILMLEKIVNEWNINLSINPDSLNGFSELGEVQQPFTSFKQAFSRLWNYSNNDYLGNRMRAISDEIIAGTRLVSGLKAREVLSNDRLTLEASGFRRDSLLHLSGTIATAEYEKSYQALLDAKIEQRQIGNDILSETMLLSRKQQEIQDIAIKKDEELQELSVMLAGTMSDLSAAIDMWKNRYLIISPVEGIVTLTKFWSPNQYVNEGETVLTVVPIDQGEIVGRVILGMQRSGKVEPGMVVNIKLSGFPYLEYGLVKGVVKNISLVASNEEYLVEVALPSGLKTIYGRDIPLTPNMSGIAEIVTSDLNLLRKMIDPLRYLMSKDKTAIDNHDFE
jgi:HlyD family secretion protein